MTAHRQIGHRPPTPLWAEWVHWMQAWFTLAALPTAWRAPAVIDCREIVGDGRYVVRAELPGVDPEHGLRVSVADGMLAIVAERRPTATAARPGEAGPEVLVRRLAVPDGVDTDAMTADYTDGVLEVSMPLRPEDQLVAWFDEIHPERDDVPIRHRD